MSGTDRDRSEVVETTPEAADTRAYPRCTKDCTVDCGKCKGDPLGALARRLRLALHFSRDAHGGVPWSEKDRWRQGHDQAQRAVLDVLEGRRQ